MTPNESSSSLRAASAWISALRGLDSLPPNVWAIALALQTATVRPPWQVSIFVS